MKDALSLQLHAFHFKMHLSFLVSQETYVRILKEIFSYLALVSKISTVMNSLLLFTSPMTSLDCHELNKSIPSGRYTILLQCTSANLQMLVQPILQAILLLRTGMSFSNKVKISSSRVSY